ncbi:MAG: outer membrane protein assembly factor BamA [Pseudomonadota bacterium]
MGNSLVKTAKLMLAMGVVLPATVQLVTPQTVFAQAITGIIVEGNARVEPDTIRAYMQFNAGEQVTDAQIDASVKALFQTGFFSDVRMFRRGSAVVVQVDENPLVNEVKIQGNDELDDKKLKTEIRLKERTIYTRARAQQDVQRLQTLYRRSGYFNAVVTPRLEPLGQNRVNLVYVVNEGSETGIESIQFQGNNAFSDSQLASVITTSESAWWKFFSTTDTYDPDRLNFDKELLRRHYLKNGFADVEIVSADAQLLADGSNFAVSFLINEGPQYTISNVSVNTGNTSIDPRALQDAVVETTGDVYDASKTDKSVEQMTLEAGKAGFAFARARPNIERDPASRQLSITYNLEEGPRVYVERIDIVGNVRTLDEVIRRELNIVEGDAYNRILIDRARRRLTGLDFFEKIDIRQEEGSAPDLAVVVIDVVEKSTGTINFSAGYSTTEQAIGSISVSERNLLGTGNQASLSTSLSFKRQSVNASYTDPYFLDRDISAGVDVFGSRTDIEDESSFTTQQVGGALRLGTRLDDYNSIFGKYSLTYRDIDVGDVEEASRAIRESEGTDIISKVGLTYVYSDLDHPSRPTSGFRGKVNVEVAGLGGDVEWGKIDASAHYFMPLLFDGVVLKVEGNAGHIEPFPGGDKVPILDRFFKGGDSLRGFARSGIGPRQRNEFDGDFDSLGAETYAIGTLEVTFPLGLPESFGLEGSVFSDFGTAFGAPERTDDPGCFGPGDDPAGDGNCEVVGKGIAFRAAVGAGVIWASPFGPLRLDVAYPILKESFDETELVRFSVGTRF